MFEWKAVVETAHVLRDFAATLVLFVVVVTAAEWLIRRLKADHTER